LRESVREGGPLPAPASWATTHTVTYGYDNADGMTSVTDFNGRQIAITSNADGQPLTETLGTSGDTITSTYDPASNLASQTLANGSSTLESFAYAFSPAGTITTETDVPSSLGSPSYTYDSLSRVLSSTPSGGQAINYGFDPSGNLTTLPAGTTSTTYDYAGELTSGTQGGTTTSYAYDADGRQLTGKQGSTTLTSATWNGASQLTAYTGPAGTMTAVYDGNGLRANKTGTTSQAFTWQVGGNRLLMDSANAYIYGADGTVAEQVNLSTGTASYLITDAIGSTRGIVSVGGALQATTSYDAWGNPTTTGGLTSYTPIGYTGGYTDPDGLIYLINRYYNPAEGQFISADPDLSQTGEPYAYTSGDPLTEKDPYGLASFTKTVAFSISTSEISWSLSLCGAALFVSACIGANFPVHQVGGHATFSVRWGDYKAGIQVQQAGGSFTTWVPGYWVCPGKGGPGCYYVSGHYNGLLVQPVMAFSLWAPPKYGSKQKAIFVINYQFSYSSRGIGHGKIGTVIPDGPSNIYDPKGSYFSWDLFGLNNWSGVSDGGGQWYPVPGANAGHPLT
jgi:RHS repeat-associated protein